MRRRIAVFLVVMLLGGSFYALAIRTPSGPRSLRVFDADRLADLEVEMWKAYYRKEKVHLFSLLVTMLHEQYRYTWVGASGAGFHLARAAAVFGDATGNYERVLPDLTNAYAFARDWTGAHYDPAAVAQAELVWWVARRNPAERDPANVGRLIAAEYALLYEAPEDRMRRAGVLRAQAGALRDAGGAEADWETVSRLLHDSYRSLHEELNQR
jgi:hypothetical protein